MFWAFAFALQVLGSYLIKLKVVVFKKNGREKKKRSIDCCAGMCYNVVVDSQ